MSSIHYKLKSALEYKTLTFEGLHISVEELKREICDKENIRSESFDLNLSNAHTKRQYTAEELIPRNSSVIVQRVPRENAAKLPKVHDTSTSGIVSKANAVADTTGGFIESEDFSKMTEEQRLAHIKEVSAQKYHPTNYQKTRGIMTGPPPPTYVCNKCGQTGHWYKLCPLLNIKRTTGIPAEELTPTTSDDPLAMLHPSGKYMKMIMHEQARRLGKQEPDAASRSPQIDDVKPPSQYTCPLCQQMLRDAVLAVCCGETFCGDCIHAVMLEDDLRRCPGTNCGEPLSPESLVENKMIRKAVQNYWTSMASGQGGGEVAGVSKPLTQSRSSSLLQKLLPEYATSKAGEPSRIRIGLASAISSGSPAQRQAVEADSSSSDLPDQSTVSPPTSQTIAESAKSALADTTPQGASSPGVFPPVDLSKPPPQTILPPFPPVNYSPVTAAFTPPTAPVVAEASSTASALPVVEIPGVGLPSTDTTSLPPMSSVVASAVPPMAPSGAISGDVQEQSKQISDAWEAFLQRKDDEKKRRRSSSRSGRSSRSSSSSSTSSSAASRSPSPRRRRRRSPPRNYYRGGAYPAQQPYPSAYYQPYPNMRPIPTSMYPGAPMPLAQYGDLQHAVMPIPYPGIHDSRRLSPRYGGRRRYSPVQQPRRDDRRWERRDREARDRDDRRGRRSPVREDHDRKESDKALKHSDSRPSGERRPSDDKRKERKSQQEEPDKKSRKDAKDENLKERSHKKASRKPSDAKRKRKHAEEDVESKKRHTREKSAEAGVKQRKLRERSDDESRRLKEEEQRSLSDANEKDETGENDEAEIERVIKETCQTVSKRTASNAEDTEEISPILLSSNPQHEEITKPSIPTPPGTSDVELETTGPLTEASQAKNLEAKLVGMEFDESKWKPIQQKEEAQDDSARQENQASEQTTPAESILVHRPLEAQSSTELSDLTKTTMDDKHDRHAESLSEAESVGKKKRKKEKKHKKKKKHRHHEKDEDGSKKKKEKKHRHSRDSSEEAGKRSKHKRSKDENGEPDDRRRKHDHGSEAEDREPERKKSRRHSSERDDDRSQKSHRKQGDDKDKQQRKEDDAKGPRKDDPRLETHEPPRDVSRRSEKDRREAEPKRRSGDRDDDAHRRPDNVQQKTDRLRKSPDEKGRHPREGSASRTKSSEQSSRSDDAVKAISVRKPSVSSSKKDVSNDNESKRRESSPKSPRNGDSRGKKPLAAEGESLKSSSKSPRGAEHRRRKSIDGSEKREKSPSDSKARRDAEDAKQQSGKTVDKDGDRPTPKADAAPATAKGDAGTDKKDTGSKRLALQAFKALKRDAAKKDEKGETTNAGSSKNQAKAGDAPKRRPSISWTPEKRSTALRKNTTSTSEKTIAKRVISELDAPTTADANHSKLDVKSYTLYIE